MLLKSHGVMPLCFLSNQRQRKLRKENASGVLLMKKIRVHYSTTNVHCNSSHMVLLLRLMNK